MLEIFYRGNNIIIEKDNKKNISFDIVSNSVLLDWFDVSFPGEYEKSSILLEVKEYLSELYYNFFIDWLHLVIISNDNFELNKDLSDFFWDIDILIIIWTKKSANIFENIEAKLVIPYWETKEIFLNTLWKHIEAVSVYKHKGDLAIDASEFINLE